MSEPNSKVFGGRVLLAVLTVYALAMILPDFARLVRPLGAWGLVTNANGLIYDVQAQFDSEDDSPAWKAGLRPGDHLDLHGMRCAPIDTDLCAANLGLWGGYAYVLPGREAKLLVAAGPDQPARAITLTAQPVPTSPAVKIVLALDQIAGVLVVLGAAWLVRVRPGAMTWGFFAYAIVFNPGLDFVFYAILHQWPRVMLAQAVANSFLQAAAYTGLLLFALRVPGDGAEGRWRLVERALPALFLLFLAVGLASLGSVFGYATEDAMQASVLLGFPVSVAAILILIGRRKSLSPRNYQRIRWIIWGCLIGLPAYLIAQLSQGTSLLHHLFELRPLSEDVSGLFYLVNGVLCLFVLEAVRRPTVVSVWIPLRRATALGLLLSVPAYFIHEELNTVHEWVELPKWAWVLLASALVFLITRLHEHATRILEWLFDRDFQHAREHLRSAGQAILRAGALAEIERLLVDEPVKSLRLASAAVFREEGGTFRRRASFGWDPSNTDTLSGTGRLLGGNSQRRPFRAQWRRRHRSNGYTLPPAHRPAHSRRSGWRPVKLPGGLAL